MLESNLKMLQEEFKRQKTEREEQRRGEEEAQVPNGVDDTSLGESNPFSTPPSSSNPFGESDISGPPSLYR